MISIREEENYTVLRLEAKRWSNKIFEILYNEVISLDDVPMIVDASKFQEMGKLTDIFEGLNTIGREHLLVLVSGADLYEDYNIHDFTLPITPTLPEAVDMLFMIKMERELGLDEI